MAQENEKNDQKYSSQISELQQLLDQSEIVRRELESQVCNCGCICGISCCCIHEIVSIF